MFKKMRRFSFLWGALLFLVTMVMLYTMLDTMSSFPKSREPDENYSALGTRLMKIEQEISMNKDVVSKIRKEVESLLTSGTDKEGVKDALNRALDVKEPRQEKTYEVTLYSGSTPSQGTCKWVGNAFSKPDINMHSLYSLLPFDNPDGGAWKQGWAVSYASDRWTPTNPLKVILVPHTHCDPGWLKTYADYYVTETKKILNNFVPKLEQNPEYKFMFSEMSYFSWWWSEVDAAMKNRVKKLIANGQFEISTGGWVMTDEANAHYYAMLDQLIEGHQWLNSTLGFVPRSGWSIDPFGYSSTMAYLLKGADMKSMLIQRVHYAIKKHLAKETSLEFMWRQHWDSESHTDIFTHMMPFYSYDVPHTCGPDPAICCQFDFRRLPGSSFRCPWKIDPKPITITNIADRTRMIVDQWKKKASLYRTNVVLVPLGDDFRYMQMDEFDLQFGNYEKIFKFLDQQPEWGVKAQFGTLSDYFDALYQDTNTKPGQPPPNIPSLSGDFFSYADREDNYWSGYYTSRPLQKNLDRTVEHNLRSAEIIFSLALAQAWKNSAANFPSKVLMGYMVEARRNLGLFQHHDGITGTSRDAVVIDYGKRLWTALRQTKTIISECATFLMAESKTDYKFQETSPYLQVDELRASHDSLFYRPILLVSQKAKPLLVYNSLGQPRAEVVKFWSSSPYVEVTDHSGQIIHSQAEPFWSDTSVIAASKFKISFVAELPGLSVKRYMIRQVPKGEDVHNHIASVTILNTPSAVKSEGSPFPVEKVTSSEDINLRSNSLSVSLSADTGMLKSVTVLASGQTFKSQLEFIQYGTRMSKEKSGAYLFLPDGDAKALDQKPVMIRVIRGPLSQEVNVFTPYIQHVLRVHNSPGVDGASVDMYNIVDIRSTRNREVGMRLHTSVDNSERIFYSDLNGFQMQKRQYYQKLTLQGNVYPMPTMAYLQDSRSRVSIMSAQSSGVANLVPGAIDVMFDRRLNQDDNRGLSQGVLDNHPTPNRFRLLFESRSEAVKSANPETSFPSMLGHLSSLSLIHPMFVMPRGVEGTELSLKGITPLLSQSLSCEMHLLNLRALQNSDDNQELKHVPKESSLMLLRHLPGDCSFPSPGLSCTATDGKVKLDHLFSNVEVKKSTVTSLTMTRELKEVDPSKELVVPPMEITAVKVHLV